MATDVDLPWFAIGGFASVVGFVVALLVTPVVRAVALATNVVDHPGDRHIHEHSTASLGGVAIFVAVVAALVVPFGATDSAHLAAAQAGWTFGWLGLGSLLILATGVVDDARGMSPWVKLLGQALAAATAIAGGYVFRFVTNPISGGVLDLGDLGVFASMLWIVGITNAFNLVDGLDGLATGIGVIACATFAAIAVAEGRPDAAVLAVCLGSVLIGFLAFNFHPASIFLGDSGSMLIGYWMAVLSMRGLQKGTTAVILLVPVLTLGLPILETSLSIIRRYLVAGSAAVFKGDREHIHHRLMSLGFHHRNAVITLYVAASLLGVAALLAVYATGPWNALLVAVVAVAMHLALRKLGYGRTGV